MERKKLLWFLDIDEPKGLNKFTMKVFWGFDISFSLTVVLFGLLFECISTSFFNIACVIFIITTAILFFVWFKLAKKVTTNIPFIPLIIGVSTLKLFYGYSIFSKGEMTDFGYPLFTWVHMTVLIVAISISLIYYGAYFKLYKDVKNIPLPDLLEREKNTIRSAEKLVKFNRWLVILPALLPSPYIASKILKIWEVGNGLGVGFCMWLLSCCWIVLASLYFPKLIVYIKHKSLL